MTNHFHLLKGQVDYTKARYVPVINCVVCFEGKVLLVKRSEDLNIYPGYWNGISGYLDDFKTISEKVAEEILEETGLAKSTIESIEIGAVLTLEDDVYQKTWLTFPVKVILNSNHVTINWEALDFIWVEKSKLYDYPLVPGFVEVYKSFFG